MGYMVLVLGPSIGSLVFLAFCGKAYNPTGLGPPLHRGGQAPTGSEEEEENIAEHGSVGSDRERRKEGRNVVGSWELARWLNLK